MKKALLIASVASMIDLFNKDNIKILKSLGYMVDVACNFDEGSITSHKRVQQFKEELSFDGTQYYQIPFPRSIFSIKNIIKSYKLTKELCTINDYDIIHCHSPIGGAITRLACRNLSSNSTRIIYTAHGFHFYSGSSIINWLLYYPIERYLSKYTDVLITINKEDHLRSQRFNSRELIYVPGIGIDVEKIQKTIVNKLAKRSEFNIAYDDYLLFTAGQLSKRKNHMILIKALSKIKNKKVKLLICGLGEKKQFLERLINKYKLNDQVILAGYRSDIFELLKSSDAFLFPSRQEGLPVALMEAMSIGLPIICSNIRGNIDLIEHKRNGFLVKHSDYKTFSKYIEILMNNSELVESIKKHNLNFVKKYDRNLVMEVMKSIYLND